MVERKSGAIRVPPQVRKDEATDFPRPDAKQVEKGAPPHEQAKGASDEKAAKQNDDAHGYSQDGGYQGSGGHAVGEDAEESEPVATRKKPGNGHTHSDEVIRSHIQQRLTKERAPRASRLIVSVGEGVVTLRGEVDDEIERRRLLDMVREVPSVRELRDELETRAGSKEVN